MAARLLRTFRRDAIGQCTFRFTATPPAVVPSQYARDIKGLGFDIITWTFERSDLRRGAATAGFYYLFDPEGKAVKKDSDMYKALDVLARQVGIIGIFSDWPATVTYYANCMGLK